MDKTPLERLDDWEALCAWLEERPYNAAYEPRCRGAYLLATPYSPQRTIRVNDPDAPPLWIRSVNGPGVAANMSVTTIGLPVWRT